MTKRKREQIEWAVVAAVLILVAVCIWASLRAAKKIESPARPYGPEKPRVEPAYHNPIPALATTTGVARVTASSPPVFAYAHATVAADGRFFVGMAGASGNPFPADEVAVFTDPADLRRVDLVSLPHGGDVVTVAYDDVRDKVYFLLTGNHDLELYELDPHTLALRTIASTTVLDAGWRPAIVTDGTYVYGITYAEHSTLFKVRISDGSLTFSAVGHIPYGHSAAIGIYGSSTELYFGGDASDMFEKADASDLAPEKIISLPGLCTETDDAPFVRTGAADGYVYVGCERAPYGYRIRTSDMTVTRFSLPGASYGFFVVGDDLYNAAQDGVLDAFPRMDIGKLERYRVLGAAAIDAYGQVPALNELLYSTTTESLYFTAWWGVKGLYEIATSS